MPRDMIILACSECRERNYTTRKNKMAHLKRMENMKYCRHCDKHTQHRETR
ncbi:MAG: 50S ribosomal protein L33 [Candidatus Zixiibacteriota bacterium]